MSTTTHIRTKRNYYFAAIIITILVVISEYNLGDYSLRKLATSFLGLGGLAVILYSAYMLFFRKGKIIFTETEFKVAGYDWVSWDDLLAVYPFSDSAHGDITENYIQFRLTDGTDLSIRADSLEMSFEEISELVNEFKTNYERIKATDDSLSFKAS